MNKNAKLKGMTLIEIIVVIAIIGILSAMVVTTWVRYTRDARINSANAEASVMFNSVQTVVQKYNVGKKDRLDVSPDDFDYQPLLKDFIAYYDGNNLKLVHFSFDGTTYTASDIVPPTGNENVFAKALLRDITAYYPDAKRCTWVFYVQDYMVRELLLKDTPSYAFGSYPNKLDLDYVYTLPKSISNIVNDTQSACDTRDSLLQWYLSYIGDTTTYITSYAPGADIVIP